MMRTLFNPDDWLGRRPGLCLVLLAITILVGGAI